MNVVGTVKRCVVGIFCGIVVVSIGLLLFGIYNLVRKQHDLEHELFEMKSEYIPVKEVVNNKQAVIERVMSSASIWRPVQDRIKDTVVQIIAHVVNFDLLQPYRTPAQGTASGSGFFINDQGDIVTNAHVVEQATAIWIQIPSLGKRVIDAHVIGIAPERDLALLRVNEADVRFIKQELGSIPFLPLGDSDAIKRSDDVLAVGYPLGQQSLKSTTGVVSGRELHMIQISAPINPGSSGGPLLNMQGEVVGINSAGIMEAQNVGYAITVNELKIVLPDLYKTKLLRRPSLGFIVNNATEAHAAYLGNPLPGGSYVVEIIKNSLMERAGVQAGDMIYEINGYPVDPFGEMTVPWSDDKLSIVDYVGRLKVGQMISLVLYRNGERKECSVRFDYNEPSAIPRVYPGYEEIDYEVFAGMVVMQLTKNHIQILVERVPGLARFTEMRLSNSPTLIVTHIFPNSQLFRCRNVAIGSTIQEVNGMPVRTLHDYRQAIKKGMAGQFITFKTADHVGRFSDNVVTVLSLDKVVQEEEKLAQCYHYPVSSMAQEIIKVCQAKHAFSGTVMASNKQIVTTS